MRPLLTFLGLSLVLGVAFVVGLRQPVAVSATAGVSGALLSAERVTVWDLDPLAIATEPVLTPRTWRKTLRGTISGTAVQRLIALAQERAPAPPSDAPVAACPFAPTLGLEFRGPAGSVWWLVEREGQCTGLSGQGMLVGPDDDVRRAEARLLRRATTAALDEIMGSNVIGNGGT
jgi:hypothetical protein